MRFDAFSKRDGGRPTEFLTEVLSGEGCPGGVLGYKRDRGVRQSLVFCTQKNTWTLYCAPKKIQDWK